jgi:hypothetical protein
MAKADSTASDKTTNESRKAKQFLINAGLLTHEVRP